MPDAIIDPAAIAARVATLRLQGFAAWWDNKEEKVAFKVPFCRLSDRKVLEDVWHEAVGDAHG